MRIHIRAHGALRPRIPQATYELPPAARVADLLALLGFQQGGVWLVVREGAMIERTAELHDGDRLELVPPLAGGG